MHFAWTSDIHVGYTTWLDGELEEMYSRVNEFDTDFLVETGDIIDSGYSSTPDLMAEQLAVHTEASKYYTNPIYEFRGNHDGAVEAFMTHGVIENEYVKLIYFHADYIGLATPPDYTNTGDVTAEELTWLEEQLSTGVQKHKILMCHWSIVEDDENFNWPITDEHGRLEVLALANTYGVKLYLNGHEHNQNLDIGTAGVLTDVNGPSATTYFCICKIYDDEAVIHMHTSKGIFKFVKSQTISLT